MLSTESRICAPISGLLDCYSPHIHSIFALGTTKHDFQHDLLLNCMSLVPWVVAYIRLVAGLQHPKDATRFR